MKGPKKDTIKLSEHGVVTEEALIAYLRNELSPEEKQQLEKLLLEDPFARDALEGLQASTNQTSVTTSITSLNKKVRERSGLKERKKLQIHWVNYAWAAVLIGLLIGIGFIMVNFLNKPADHNLALNEKKEPVQSPAAYEKKDTSVVEEKLKVADLDTLATGKKLEVRDTTTHIVTFNGTGAAAKPNNPPLPIASDAKNTVAANNQAINNPTTIASQDKKTAAPASKLADNYNVNASANKTKSLADSVVTYGYSTSSNMGVTSAELSKKELKPEAKDAATLLDDAMKSFNAGDYNAAADGFEKILKHDPENADALYFGGISDYINGKVAKSEINFDKLLKKGNKYTEGSKWYKANILIKKGKTEAAKPLLQDLTNSNGSYKERAIKKLAELGF